MIEAETGETMTFARYKERVDWMAVQYYIRGWEQGEVRSTMTTPLPSFIVPDALRFHAEPPIASNHVPWCS